MFGQEPTERHSNYDVQHINIKINIDLKEKFLWGTVETSIIPSENDLTSFEVDAIGMNIKKFLKFLILLIGYSIFTAISVITASCTLILST